MDEDYDHEFRSPVQKLPLKCLQVAIHKLTNIAIPLHLELLLQQKGNIEKFQRLSEWLRLDKELINASRTIQQLKADINEMELIRSQIIDRDLKDFDMDISVIKEKTLHSIQEFIDLHTEVTKPVIHKNKSFQCDSVGCDSPSNSDGIISKFYEQPAEEIKSCSYYDSNNRSNNETSRQIQSQMENNSINDKLSYSWFGLRKSLEDLNGMIHSFSHQVHNQQNHVDSIENNIESSHSNVKSGVTHLSKAAKLKGVIVPVAGAVIGGCAGGPFGFVLGLKAGLAVGVGGSLVGYQAGRMIKNRQAKVTDLEMETMSGGLSRSVSMPEVKSDFKL